MAKQKHLHRLPPLSEFRLRRLRLQVPLDVLAVEAGLPSASLSRFERNEHPLSDEQRERLEKTLARMESSR